VPSPVQTRDNRYLGLMGHGGDDPEEDSESDRGVRLTKHGMDSTTTTPSALSTGVSRSTATPSKVEDDRAAMILRHQMEMEAYDASVSLAKRNSSTTIPTPRRSTTERGDV
jgi:hypothetical protein